MRDPNSKYILVDKKPVIVEDLFTWGRWFEDEDRHVSITELKHPFIEGKGCRVSTVFLGLDHNYCDEGHPVLFETMIFEGEFDNYQERYCTWEEAEEGHKQAVQMVMDIYELNSQPGDLC